MATAPLLGRAIPHLRLRLHLNTTLPAAVCLLIQRPYYTTTTAELNRPIKKVPSTTTTTTYDDKASLLSTKPHPPKDPKWENDPDYRKWKDKEAEIFRDIDPITLLVKDILHSDRESLQRFLDWRKVVIIGFLKRDYWKAEATRRKSHWKGLPLWMLQWL